jgi:hypothetical protein
MVANNVIPQVWDDGNFTAVASIPGGAFDLFPRVHVAFRGLPTLLTPRQP